MRGLEGGVGNGRIAWQNPQGVGPSTVWVVHGTYVTWAFGDGTFANGGTSCMHCTQERRGPFSQSVFTVAS